MGKKHTYKEVKDIVEGFGYELISKEYISIKEKIILKDKEGYYYHSTFDNVKNGKIPEKFHKSNSYTLQNIKLWLILNNFQLEIITSEYLGNDNKLLLKDKEEYYYEISWNNLQNGKNAMKFSKYNNFTLYNINLWCILNNKPFELMDNQLYKDSIKNKLKWRCLKSECGEIFETNWANISSGDGCAVCAGRQVSLLNCLATKNPELAKEWHPTKNGDLTPYNTTMKSNKNIWWQCDKNPKHIWCSKPNNRTRGRNCPYCSGRLPSEDYNLLVCNPKLCEEWDYERNKNKPEDYCPNSNKYAWWKCKECGHKWYVKISNRKYCGCPECAESHGEIRIREWVKLNYIKYIPQKTFEGLVGVGNGLLSYDFYLPNYNLLIEFQGLQHEKFIKGMHKCRRDFETQVEHDHRKLQYALDNNIKLLEIWYYDFDRVEKILEKELLNKKELVAS